MNTAKLAAATALALSFSASLAAADPIPPWQISTYPMAPGHEQQLAADRDASGLTANPSRGAAWEFRCTQAKANAVEDWAMIDQFCGPQDR